MLEKVAWNWWRASSIPRANCRGYVSRHVDIRDREFLVVGQWEKSHWYLSPAVDTLAVRRRRRASWANITYKWYSLHVTGIVATSNDVLQSSIDCDESCLSAQFQLNLSTLPRSRVRSQIILFVDSLLHQSLPLFWESLYSWPRGWHITISRSRVTRFLALHTYT